MGYLRVAVILLLESSSNADSKTQQICSLCSNSRKTRAKSIQDPCLGHGDFVNRLVMEMETTAHHSGLRVQGQGGLVSMSRLGIVGVNIWLIGVIYKPTY